MIYAVELDVKYFATPHLFIMDIHSVFEEIIKWSNGDPFFSCLEFGCYIAISSVARDKCITTGFLHIVYRRGVRSSQTKTCCLPSIFLRFLSLVRNSFLFLYDTNLAMIGRGFSLYFFYPSRCSLLSVQRRNQGGGAEGAQAPLLNNQNRPIDDHFLSFSPTL